MTTLTPSKLGPFSQEIEDRLARYARQPSILRGGCSDKSRAILNCRIGQGPLVDEVRRATKAFTHNYYKADQGRFNKDDGLIAFPSGRRGPAIDLTPEELAKVPSDIHHIETSYSEVKMHKVNLQPVRGFFGRVKAARLNPALDEQVTVYMRRSSYLNLGEYGVTGIVIMAVKVEVSEDPSFATDLLVNYTHFAKPNQYGEFSLLDSFIITPF